MPGPGEMTAKAMLCEFAQAINGRLYIMGGNVTDVAVPGQLEPPYQIPFAIALTIQVPWHLTNQVHQLRVEMVSDSVTGQHRVPINFRQQDDLPEDERGMIRADFNVGRPADMIPGSDAVTSLVFPTQGKELPVDGPYYISIWLDGVEVDRVSFRLRREQFLLAG